MNKNDDKMFNRQINELPSHFFHQTIRYADTLFIN